MFDSFAHIKRYFGYGKTNSDIKPAPTAVESLTAHLKRRAPSAMKPTIASESRAPLAQPLTRDAGRDDQVDVPSSVPASKVNGRFVFHEQLFVPKVAETGHSPQTRTEQHDRSEEKLAARAHFSEARRGLHVLLTKAPVKYRRHIPQPSDIGTTPGPKKSEKARMQVPSSTNDKINDCQRSHGRRKTKGRVLSKNRAKALLGKGKSPIPAEVLKAMRPNAIAIPQHSCKGSQSVQGNLRTKKNIRPSDPKFTAKCGDSKLHKLVYNRWVRSPSRCGRNCRNGNPMVDAFFCKECHDVAMDIIKTKLTKKECVKCKSLMKGPVDDFVAYLSELLTPHLGDRDGVDELARMIATHNKYGRPCKEFMVNDLPVRQVVYNLDREFLEQDMLAAKKKLTKEGKPTQTTHFVTPNQKITPTTSYTVVGDMFRPLTQPNRRNAPAFYFVEEVCGDKRRSLDESEDDFDDASDERDSKRPRIIYEEVEVVVEENEKPKIPYLKFYGNIAVWTMPNGSRRVVSRDTNRRASSPYHIDI